MSAASNSSETAGAAESPHPQSLELLGASRDQQKWPAYRTLGMLAVVNVVLWGALALVGVAVGRAFGLL